VGGAGIHTANGPDGTGVGQQLFRQGGFSCVYVSENTNISNMFHGKWLL
jgi:hypothetical protein